jgi:hypothetical protein
MKASKPKQSDLLIQCVNKQLAMSKLHIEMKGIGDSNNNLICHSVY